MTFKIEPASQGPMQSESKANWTPNESKKDEDSKLQIKLVDYFNENENDNYFE